jgi:hypothetical protein
MLRGEVEDWLAAKDNTLRERAEKLQEDTLWWAKAAAWIAGAGRPVPVAHLNSTASSRVHFARPPVCDPLY